MPRAAYQSKLQPILGLCQFQKHEDNRKNAKNPVLKEEDRITDAQRHCLFLKSNPLLTLKMNLEVGN